MPADVENTSFVTIWRPEKSLEPYDPRKRLKAEIISLRPALSDAAIYCRTSKIGHLCLQLSAEADSTGINAEGLFTGISVAAVVMIQKAVGITAISDCMVYLLEWYQRTGSVGYLRHIHSMAMAIQKEAGEHCHAQAHTVSQP